MNIFPRFIELDLWRGSAVLAMLIYHAIFVKDFLGPQELFSPELGWILFARMIQWSFLLLVGLSLHLSWQKYRINRLPFSEFYRHQFKRGIIVICSGLIITLVTSLFIPEWRILFGVLHFIGSAILITSIFVRTPLLAGFLAPLVLIFSWWVRFQEWDSFLGMVLGFRVPGLQALDYFPIFPWLGIPLLGICLGSLLYPGYRRRFPAPNLSIPTILKPLQWLSRHALIIYLVHIPIIALVISLFLA